MSGPKAPTPVVTNAGKVGYLPAALADEATGVRQASDEQLRAAQLEANRAATAADLRAQFEGSLLNEAEGAVMPALAGAARGLSLGLSDEAAVKIGGETARKRLLDYQAYAPAASVVGELGGIVGGALLGDEAALGSIPNAVGRLGGAAERFVARGLGEGALGHGAGVLARGAAEGAVFGTGNAISESALHNTDLSGEAIIGGAAHGALGGMVASGLLHGAGKAFGALRRPSAEAYDALAAREFGEAAPGVGREMAAKARAHPEDVLAAEGAPGGGPYRSGGLLDTVGDTVANRGENAKIQREIWRNRDVTLRDAEDRISNHTRDVAESVTKQQEAARITDMATYGDSKVNHMEKLVSPSNFRGQLAAVDAWTQRAQAELAPLVGDVNGGLSNKAVQQFDGHIQRLRAAAESGDGAKLFRAADDMKRWLGKQAQFGRSAFGLSEAARTFDGLYKGESGLQRVLEDGVWGKAGEAQRAVNAATNAHLNISERFEAKMMAKYGATEGRPNFVGDPEKIASFLGKLTKASNDLDAQAAREWMQSRRALLDATEKSYDHGPAAIKAIQAERKAIDRIEQSFEKATKEAALINQTKRLAGEEQASMLGGWAGLLMDTVSKPITTMRRLAQVEEHTNKVLTKIGVRSRELANAAPAGAAKANAPAAGAAKGGGFFSMLLKDAGKGADLGANATGAKVMRNEHEKRVEALTKMQASPAMVTQKVGAALGPLGEAAPKTAGAATSIAINGLNFLASKLPMSRQDPYSLTPQFQTGTKASDSEIAQHMRYIEALDNPAGLLDKAFDGKLTPEHVEAVREVYPKLYDQMRTQVMQGLVDAKSELPYGRRIQLGILLDLPTDQTLAPDFVSAIQATYTAAEKAGQEPPPPNLTALNVSSSLETATQAAAEGLDR